MPALERLEEAQLFAGLSEVDCRAVAALARRRTTPAGEVLFRMGDLADEVYVIRRGRVELTFPLTVMGETKEIRFQSLEPGWTLAWSALVPPHRLTMSARAATEVELLGFERARLLDLFQQRPTIGCTVMSKLCHVVAARFQEMAALWVREVQRNVSQTYR
jgi:CRP/FNR family transcriptional regulator, cyclic AMP receptor protein